MASYDTKALFQGLRVCMVAPYKPRNGGVVIQAHLMVEGLESYGAEVHRVDTILHKLQKGLLLPIRMLLQPLSTAYRFLREAPRCDIVHIHACSWWGFLPVVACAPLNRLFTRKRLVISFHGAKGHLWIRRYWWLGVPLMRMADELIVVSPKLQRAFAEKGLKSTFLRNLVSLDRFQFRERGYIKPNIVWIRHFEDMYDPLTALAVFSKVKQEMPEASITFIGDGSLWPEMDRYIQEHGLTDVRFTGRLQNEQVPDVFDEADVFLNTSTHDGLPTALLEASASGLPIVTTAAGGIPDMLENGKEGIVVPVGDVDALAREVIGLIRDPTRAHAMGIAARRNAERYGWPECARQLARAYGLPRGSAPGSVCEGARSSESSGPSS